MTDRAGAVRLLLGLHAKAVGGVGGVDRVGGVAAAVAEQLEELAAQLVRLLDQARGLAVVAAERAVLARDLAGVDAPDQKDQDKHAHAQGDQSADPEGLAVHAGPTRRWTARTTPGAFVGFF